MLGAGAALASTQSRLLGLPTQLNPKSGSETWYFQAACGQVCLPLTESELSSAAGGFAGALLATALCLHGWEMLVGEWVLRRDVERRGEERRGGCCTGFPELHGMGGLTSLLQGCGGTRSHMYRPHHVQPPPREWGAHADSARGSGVLAQHPLVFSFCIPHIILPLSQSSEAAFVPRSTEGFACRPNQGSCKTS